MSQRTSGGIEALRSTVAGAVIFPGDPGYDTARSLWNGSFDRRPAVIVLRLLGGRGRGARVRSEQRVGDLGARRGPLLQRSLGR